MNKLYEESFVERVFTNKLRELAIIELKKLDLQTAADKLNLARGGVEALLWEQRWSLETAYRVALALDLQIMKQINKTIGIELC